MYRLTYVGIVYVLLAFIQCCIGGQSTSIFTGVGKTEPDAVKAAIENATIGLTAGACRSGLSLSNGNVSASKELLSKLITVPSSFVILDSTRRLGVYTSRLKVTFEFDDEVDKTFKRVHGDYSNTLHLSSCQKRIKSWLNELMRHGFEKCVVLAMPLSQIDPLSLS